MAFKELYIMLLFIGYATTAVAQTVYKTTLKEIPLASIVEKPKRCAKAIIKYQQAKTWLDNDVAIEALYNVLSFEPNNKAIKDTLVKYYINLKRYPQATAVLTELLSLDSNNVSRVKQCAELYKSMNNLEGEIKANRKLAALTKNPAYAYKVAVIQIENMQLNNALQTASDLLLHELSGNRVLTELNNGQQQAVDLKAALNNLIGIIYFKQLKYQDANRYFQLALNIAPEFILAKRNKAALEQKILQLQK